MKRDRLLRNTGAALEVTFYSGETPADADGAVTVDVVAADGTVIANDAPASHVGTAGSGTYRYALAPRADLDVVTLDWSGTFGGIAQTIETSIEVMGAFYVSLAEIRTLDGLDSTTKFPTAKLIAARDWFQDLAENYCGKAFVPRYARELCDGDGTDELFLSQRFPRRLRSVKVGGVAVDLAQVVLKPKDRKIRLIAGSFTIGDGNVDVIYEHGLDEPPNDVAAAALTAIGAKLLGDRTSIPERAVTMTTGDNTYSLALAGVNRPTGIPSVDAVLNQHRGSATVLR